MNDRTRVHNNPVTRVRDFEQALHVSNDTEFGLSAVPFGGRKASSYGPREQGGYTVDFYTVVKTAHTSA